MKNDKWYYKLSYITIALLLIFTLSVSEAEAFAAKKSLEELSDEADAVIAGTVENITSYWHDDYNSIYSTVVVWVDDIFKGEEDREKITIVISGGEINGLSQIVSDMPLFEPGEQALLFLNDLDESALPGWVLDTEAFELTGNFQGKYGIDDERISDIPLDLFMEEFEAYSEQGIQFNFDFFDDDDSQSGYVNNNDFVYLGIRWPGSSPQVPYIVNAPAVVTEQISAAANTWSKAGANFNFIYKTGQTSTSRATFNGINEIFTGNLGHNRALAVATIWFNGSHIIEADMTFNSNYNWSPTGTNFQKNIYDIQTVALHEFGHWLGLDHSPIFGSIMYHYIKGDQHTLHPVDVEGIRYIYGTAESAVEAPSEPCTISIPSRPSGSSEGYRGTSYSFSTSGAACSNGHKIEYRFDWGDGSNSNWGSEKTSKIWNSDGAFNVRVRARCTVDNNILSDWSLVKHISITSKPKDEDNTNNNDENNEKESDEPIVNYSLNINTEGEGSTDPAMGEHQYKDNSEVELAATPAQGWRFEKWVIDDLEFHNSNITVNIIKNREATAYFTQVILGDITGNGEITVNDVVLVMRHVLGQTTLNKDKKVLADVNGDGKIDVKDVTLIMRFALGVIDKFPAN